MEESKVLTLPKQLNVQGAISFSRELYNMPISREYIVDFSYLEKAFPFSILLSLANLKSFFKNTARELRSCGVTPVFKARGIRLKDNPIHGYLAHIGFFKDLGLNIGRAPGEAWGSHGYVPIVKMDRSDIRSEAMRRGVHYGNILIEKSEKLSTVITNALKPNSCDLENEYIFKALSYIIREIMRNAYEHSKSKNIVYCGQYFPKIGCAEIAILDHGIGIHDSLYRKHGYESAQESIENALLPGISSKLDFSVDDKWGNSGFGLYTTRRICTYFPSDQFAIASSGMLIASHHKSEKNIFNKLLHPGTAVMMKISRNDEFYFENILEKIIAEGERIASNSGSGVKASKMSKILK